jgi:phosphoribosylanthranilate isomerase
MSRGKRAPSSWIGIGERHIQLEMETGESAFPPRLNARIAVVAWPPYYGGMPTASMFRIKICGITSIQDALVAANAGADAIGLNFWPQSRRYVRTETAREIAAALPRGVVKVGVFVNATVEDIAPIADYVGLDWIQLHGDEPADLLAKLPATAFILRAYRCGEEGLAPLKRYLTESREHGRGPDAVLVDADAANEFGGTGRKADWERIAMDRDLLGGLPLILAGGLTQQNVAGAIDAVRPDGVDVASGVESQAGVKEREMVEQFVAAARAKLAGL